MSSVNPNKCTGVFRLFFSFSRAHLPLIVFCLFFNAAFLFQPSILVVENSYQ